MSDSDQATNKPKVTIKLPSIKKPNPQELRKDLKGFQKPNKHSAIKNTNLRRAGPRGG